jgi:hypothetical protein
VQQIPCVEPTAIPDQADILTDKPLKLTTMKTSIDFTRINNDVNGNPRYVCHFLSLLSTKEQDEISSKARPFQSINDMYREAVNKARTIGGRKYTAKNYGGGIVFQSYNIADLEKSILELTK